MNHPNKDYLPAAGKDWLLFFYDPFTWLLGVGAVHTKLIRQSGIEPGFRVLEIGCGTGNLTLQAKRMNPDVQIVGMDPDPKALARAGRKARRSGLEIQFDQGFSEDLSYPDASFDRVLSAFMFHHIPPDAKLLAIQEVFRVLKPGGSLHLVDFGKTHVHEDGGGLHRILMRRMHGSHGTSPHQMVLEYMREAGFEESREVAQQSTLMGGVSFYEGTRP